MRIHKCCRGKQIIFLFFPYFLYFRAFQAFLPFFIFSLSWHIFVSNFGKFFGKFQVSTNGFSAVGKRQVRNWELAHLLTKLSFFHTLLSSLCIDCLWEVFLCILNFHMGISIHRDTYI